MDIVYMYTNHGISGGVSHQLGFNYMSRNSSYPSLTLTLSSSGARVRDGVGLCTMGCPIGYPDANLSQSQPIDVFTLIGLSSSDAVYFNRCAIPKRV